MLQADEFVVAVTVAAMERFVVVAAAAAVVAIVAVVAIAFDVAVATASVTVAIAVVVVMFEGEDEIAAIERYLVYARFLLVLIEVHYSYIRISIST